jgi:hypothetical protein
MSARTSRSFLEMPWRWSVVSTPILAALTLYTLGALVDVLNVGTLYVFAVAVFGAIGTATACRRADLGRFANVYAVSVVVAAGLWLTWTALETAWSMPTVTVLACGLALFGAVVVPCPTHRTPQAHAGRGRAT